MAKREKTPPPPDPTPSPSPGVPVAPKNEDKLLALTRAAITDLTETEEQLVRHVARGELFRPKSVTEDKPDPAKAKDWGADRTIRADVLNFLCTDKAAREFVTHRGIRALGLRVTSTLNLEEATVSFPLNIKYSHFVLPLILLYARIKALYFDGTHVSGMSAHGIRVESHIFLRNGFRATGEVGLNGATIGGNLSCAGGNFVNPTGSTLKADGLKVTGSVSLNSTKDARFESQGEVRLLGATIGGDLDCTGGKFENVEPNITSTDHFALNADRIKVTGNVFLNSTPGARFESHGGVCLMGATIGVNLQCDGGKFENTYSYALNADGIKVPSIFFRKFGKWPCEINGLVSLVSARIESDLQWHGLTNPQNARLDLRWAKIGALYDDNKSWPSNENLWLDHFTYEHIHHGAPTNQKQRYDWLRRQYPAPRTKGSPTRTPKLVPFNPQPYEYLAEVLKRMGHDKDARQILIHKEKDRAQHTKMKMGAQFWHWLLGETIAYGYEPWRAFFIGLFFIVAGAFAFYSGDQRVLMRPTSVDAVKQEEPDKLDVKVTYPAFNPLFYSVDEFLPIINLRMGDYYVPDAHRGYVYFKWPFVFRTGTLLRWYLWAHILVGWLLTTLFVAGVTGIIRK